MLENYAVKLYESRNPHKFEYTENEAEEKIIYLTDLFKKSPYKADIVNKNFKLIKMYLDSIFKDINDMFYVYYNFIIEKSSGKNSDLPTRVSSAIKSYIKRYNQIVNNVNDGIKEGSKFKKLTHQDFIQYFSGVFNQKKQDII